MVFASPILRVAFPFQHHDDKCAHRNPGGEAQHAQLGVLSTVWQIADPLKPQSIRLIFEVHVGSGHTPGEDARPISPQKVGNEIPPVPVAIRHGFCMGEDVFREKQVGRGPVNGP